MLVFEINELPNLAKGKGNKIMNIPKPKFLAGEENMSHICLIGESSSIQIHSGKRHMNLKLKDCENYISSRAKRGLMLPQGYRKVDKVIEIIDLVCIMSVNPGFGGQSFIPKTYNRILDLRELIDKKDSSALIEIDGGVTDQNAKQLVVSGATVLVAGNHFFKAIDPSAIIAQLKAF